MIRILSTTRRPALVVPILFFAVLTAVTARIVIPLPFSPVPITLQLLAVLLSGLVLGSRAGAASQLAYLTAIAAGVPLSAAAVGGPAAFVTPTAGYLVAFVPAAFVAGWFVERVRWGGWWEIPIYFAVSLAGVLVIYAGGVAWLAIVLGDPMGAVRQGLLPFIAIDLAKAGAAAIVAGGGRLLFFPPTKQ